MKTVLYASPYVPAEWIAAHELRPSRILPAVGKAGNRSAPIGLGIGVCPYARAFANEACAAAEETAAVVVATTCDQMRRMAERIERISSRPVFLLDVPKTWQTVAVRTYYRSEIERLGRFLVELGGCAPTRERLADAMLEWDEKRAALRARRGRLSAGRFARAVADLIRTGEAADSNLSDTIEIDQGVPVALVGGSLPRNHFTLFESIEAAGGAVVLDASGSGERVLPAPFDRRALREDPLLALVESYFAMPDVFQRPNSALYAWMRREMAARGVCGILFRYAVWCDLWHAEAQRMKEWAALPFLLLEAGDEEEVNGHAASRIEAFLEMLK